MTEPGYVMPASPGWWVRSNRVGQTSFGYTWGVTAAGARDPHGQVAGQYGWVGAAEGYPTEVQFVGVNIAAGNTVALPAHRAGDLILVFAYRATSDSAPAAPSAGGTVPTFTSIQAGGTSVYTSARLAWASATA